MVTPAPPEASRRESGRALWPPGTCVHPSSLCAPQWLIATEVPSLRNAGTRNSIPKMRGSFVT